MVAGVANTTGASEMARWSDADSSDSGTSTRQNTVGFEQGWLSSLEVDLNLCGEFVLSV